MLQKSMKFSCIFVSTTLLFLLLMEVKSQEQNKAVYYLSIGSGHYNFDPLRPADKPFQSLIQLPEAIASAKIMGKLLETYAGAKGITFCSSREKLFSKPLFNTQLNNLFQTIRNDKVANPLVVIYYCGHGFSENLVGSQLLLTGNFPKILKTGSYEEMRTNNVTLEDILPSLMFSGLRYLILLDCCRGKEKDDSLNMDIAYKKWDTLSLKKIKTGFDSLTQIVRAYYDDAINKADPVILASLKMAGVATKDYPSNTLNLDTVITATQVGPICRRAFLILDKQQSKNHSISLKAFVAGLINPMLDSKEQSAVSATGYKFNNTDDYPIFQWK